MNKKDYELWDASIKYHSKKTGKPIEEVQNMLSITDMEICTRVRALVKGIHTQVLNSKQPQAQVINAIAELIRPFPLDMKLDFLGKLVNKLEELEEYDVKK